MLILELIRKILLVIFAVFIVILGFTFATIKFALFILVMPFLFLALLIAGIAENLTRKE